VTDAPRGATSTTASLPLHAPTDSTPPAGPGRQRAPRQAPADLTIRFADDATVRAHSAALAEPDWLLADRLAGLADFDRLPIESNVLYTTYVDLRNARLAEIRPVGIPSAAGASSAGLAAEAGVPSVELPADAAALIEVGADGASHSILGPEAVSAGLLLESFTEFRARDEAGFRAFIESRTTLPDGDRLAALTRSLWREGIHLAAPRGVRLSLPIVIRWHGAEPGGALLTRTFIDLAADADVSVVEELSSSSTAEDAQSLFTGTAEVRLGEGSTLSFASLQELSLADVAFQHRTAAIGARASIHWALAQLGTRLVRSRVDNALQGDGSSVEQVEIVFGSGDQLFDLTSYTRHVGRDATSNLLSKAVLQDSARTFLKGLVTIDKSGSGTDSFLGEYAMNLSKKARAVAIPSLEIDQPDCRRVAHSSSVGPIDETQLFYLESRGISPEDARKFIVLGFLEPVVARVPLESARDRLRDLLEAKWDAAHVEPASAA